VSNKKTEYNDMHKLTDLLSKTGLLFLTLSTSLFALENSTCKRCHPKIYQEYQNSMHKRASIYNDPVHAAVWEHHPLNKKGKYKCAKCHTPSDPSLKDGEGLPQKNSIQLQEPIACTTCHKIESIEKHAKSNTNIYTKEPKTFYAADEKRKGQKLVFQEESSFLGLMRKTVGSPYHDIDYGNENFYNGNVCLGCHDHKENSKGFAVCDMDIKQDPANKEKQNCITCHMPKIKGSFVTLHDSPTHAYHGSNIVTASPAMLEKYVVLDLQKNASGFTVTIENKANHPLFPHPLRLGELHVVVQKAGEQIKPKVKRFARIIGTDGKPSSPWLADSVISDTTIKAHEKRAITYDIPLQTGDEVTVVLGYHIVNPKMAKKLGITEEHYIRFIPFTKKRFQF
jgi:DNA-directed RNA polymerase subunit RPC12/RpoP